MRKALSLIVSFLLLIAVFAVLVGHVSTDLTDEDRQQIETIVAELQLTQPQNLTLIKELELIRTIQHGVLAHVPLVPGARGIPKGQTREPHDVWKYAEQGALCYDRSRLIEKVADYLGFQTRHLSIFVGKRAFAPLISLIKVFTLPKGHPSHAVSEILTKKGWVVVDSNVPFMSVDTAGQPRSARQIVEALQKEQPFTWSPDFAPSKSEYFEAEFIHVAGLYSRHGQFYPPFLPVPDFNTEDLAASLSGF